MKKEVAEAWVKDLREHPDKQARGKLYDGEKSCCLGRLCLLLGHQFVISGGKFVLEGTDEGAILPDAIMAQAGIRERAGCLYLPQELFVNGRNCNSLTELNDNGYTFPQIANVIERNWRKL